MGEEGHFQNCNQAIPNQWSERNHMWRFFKYVLCLLKAVCGVSIQTTNVKKPTYRWQSKEKNNRTATRFIYSWECVSFTFENRTFDFRLNLEHNKHSVYILINAMQELLKRNKKLNYIPRQISQYRVMSIKMKISYEALS